MATRGALAVGAGILFSRLSGLFRSSLLGSFLGVGPHADVLSAAFRLPNLVQNLLGEQTLSASFIPIYSRLLGEGRRAEAGRFAGAIFALLVATAGGAALIGVVLARPIVALFATGFLRDRELVERGLATVDRFPLAVSAVQWIFPMTALLVLSAWALGVLNSHGKFLLSYLAPVVWNVTIAAMVAWFAFDAAPAPLEGLLRAACLGALVGGLLQFLIQLPGVIRHIEGWTWRPGLSSPPVREALRAFIPTVAGRGVVQLSSYLDQILASLLTAGAVGALGYAQALYLLPISLFGLSIAAAALPELARRRGAGEAEFVREHLRESMQRVAYFNLPSTVAYLLLGLPIVDGIFRLFGGRFGGEASGLVYATLAAYSLGLPAATQARILQSGLYAAGDAKSPARWAALRVGISALLGVPAMLWLDRYSVQSLGGAILGTNGTESSSALRLGAVGLAIGASLGAWLEVGGLRRAAAARFGESFSHARDQARWAAVAVVAALPAVLLFRSGALGTWHPSLRAALLVAVFAFGYLALTLREVPARAFLGRFGRRKES